MTTAISATSEARLLVDQWQDDIKLALPPNITFERMKATFITAVAHNPEILTCDPQSIRTSLLKAATDNLLPDNREAAIVPYWTKVKEGDREVSKKLAQYMPMVAGIRKRAKELGGIRTITSEVVYSNDFFEREAGDDPKITHKPPKLGTSRGDVIGAYAIFKDDSDFIVHREVMDKDEIEKARNVSRAKNGPGWTNFYGEMCRKTVVRRGAKSVPSIPEELRTIIERDDEVTDFQLTSSKTIEGSINPLLEDGSSLPMDRIDSSTGEIIETKSTERQVSTRQAQTTNSSSRTSSSQADDEKSSGGANTSSQRAPAGDFTEFSMALLRFGGTGNGREADIKKITAATDQFWESKGGRPDHPADSALAKSIIGLHLKRMAGELDIDAVKADSAKAVDSSYNGL